MKIKQVRIISWVLVFALVVSACKSEFEKVRTSNNPEQIYQKALAYYEQEDYQKSQTLLELILNSYRGKAEAEDIYFKYAYTYYNLKRYILAAYYFRNFATTFGNSPKREEAEFMAAYSNYELSPTFRLDQTYTEKAIDDMQTFVNTYPNSQRVDECNKIMDELRSKLEEKAFAEAELYFNLKQYLSAVHTFENMLKDFPETNDADKIRFMIVRSYYLLAENSVVEKQPERYQTVLERAGEYLQRYPKSEYAKEVSLFLNNSTKKLKNIRYVGHQDQSARAGS